MMILARCSLLWTVVLLAFSPAPACAQQSTLSNISFSPCCIAPDGHGNNFVVSSSQASSFSVAKVDSSGTVVSISSYPALASDTPSAAAVDPQGNLWIVGSGAFGSAANTPVVGIIAKIDSTGANLLYAGAFGGKDPSGFTRINAIAIDPDGNLYLGGYTFQSDFPLTPGAFMSQFGTTPGCVWDGAPPYGFITKLTPTSQNPPYKFAYSTLLGGQQVPPGACGPFPPNTTVTALAVDEKGVVTVAGSSDALDFPVTPGAFQKQYQGAVSSVSFITRLNAQGTGLVWSTLLGEASATDSDSIGVVGIAVDSDGSAVVTGGAVGEVLPVTPGAIQSEFASPPNDTAVANGFVAKLDSTGASLLFATYYGVVLTLSSPRLDAQGDIWITESLWDQTGLVLHANSLNLGDSLIAEIAPDGSSVLFSELLPNGVAGQDLVLNPDGSLTVIGIQSANLDSDPSSGFVLRLPRGAPTGVSVLGVADSAVDGVIGQVAPGEFLSIYGTGLGPAVGVGMQIGPSGTLTTLLGGTEVSVDGILAPLLYASDSQINLLVPYEIANSKQVNIQISTHAGSSQTGPLQVVPAQSSVFTVLNSDGSVNSPSNPASQGSLISIFVSGAGALNPALPDGTIATSPAPVPALPVQVDFSFFLPSFLVPLMDHLTITPLYAGGVPGTVIDMLRVDVKIPTGLDGDWGFTADVQVGSSHCLVDLYVGTGVAALARQSGRRVPPAW